MDAGDDRYSESFRRAFHYEGPSRPRVRIEYLQRAETLRGRLVAERLKPNFAYQLKLAGHPDDPDALQRIGRLGRWWLPGRGANASDAEYERYEPKAEASSYIFFDFFVTDAGGNAARDFALDSTLHVLWRARPESPPPPSGLFTPPRRSRLEVSDAAIYAQPSAQPAEWLIYAEAERTPGRPAPGRLRLPAGSYRATLFLTEESFHGSGDAGDWATVMQSFVRFHILEPRQ